MPQLIKFTPQQLEQGKVLLQEMTPRRINEDYLIGEITSGERRSALEFHGQMSRALAAQGGATGIQEVDAYIQGVVQQYQGVWDQKRGDMNLFQGLMTAMEALKGLDIPGDVVERKAAQFGAPAGLAYLMNWAVWIPANFMSIGAMLKPFTLAAGLATKGVKGTSKVAGIGMDKLIKHALGNARKLEEGAVSEAGQQAGKVTAENAAKVVKGAEAGEKATGVVPGVQPAAPAPRGKAQTASGGEPPVEEGFVRYYRADTSMEGGKAASPMGENWAKGKDYVEAKYGTPEGTTFYVDVPLESFEYGVAPSVTKLSPDVVSKAKPLGKGEVFTSAKESPEVSEEVVKRGKEFVKLQEQDEFADDLAEAFGADRETIDQIIETPQSLENASVSQTVEYYRNKAREQIRKKVSHGQTEAEQVGSTSFTEMAKRLRGASAAAPELKEMVYVADQIAAGLDDVIERALPELDDLIAGKRPDLALDLKNHLSALADASNPALGAIGEQGRGLEILKTVQPELQRMRLYQNVLEELGGEALAESSDAAVAAAVTKLGLLGKEHRKEFLAQAATENRKGFLHSAFKSLLLASGSTHLVNTAGSLQGILAKLSQDTGAAFLPFTKGAPSTQEALGQWAGFVSAFGQMPRILRQATERSTKALEKVDVTQAQDIISRYGPLRLMGIEDEIIGAILEQSLVHGRIVQEGLQQGLSGKGMKDYITATFADTKKMASMSEEFAPQVDNALFRGRLGPWGEKIVKATRESKLDYYLPFIRTPTNLLKTARDWTPGLNLASKKIWDDFAEGGAREAAARSRMTLSWMFSSQIYAAAKAGIITGGGPLDPDLKKEWELAGNTPYSIHGYGYRIFEPFATVIGAIADFAAISNELTMEDRDEFSTAISVTLGRALENNYWLRQMEGLTQAVTGLKEAEKWSERLYTMGRVALQPAIAVATGGPVGSRIREQFDNEVKDIRGLTDFFKSKVWGYSKDVPPRLNFSGEAVTMPPPVGGVALNYFTSALRYKNQKDSVSEFLVKYDLQLEDRFNNFGGTIDLDQPFVVPGKGRVRANLDAKESHDFKSLALKQYRDPDTGMNWIESVAALEEDPYFQDANRTSRQAQVSRLYRGFRKSAWEDLQALNPAVRAKAERADRMTEALKSGGEQSLFQAMGFDDVEVEPSVELEPEPEVAPSVEP